MLKSKIPEWMKNPDEEETTSQYSSKHIDIGIQIPPLWMRTFKNITYLDCSGQQLHELPFLPPKLISLQCSHNQLSTLSELPNSLLYLHVKDNMLTILPNLPQSLLYLDIAYNYLTEINKFPPRLINLNITANSLRRISQLPRTLLVFKCYFNRNITSLGKLPENLLTLLCGYCGLLSLPNLPKSLTFLDCSGNNLTSLPILPRLVYLECSSNHLTSLPELPNTLTHLYCENNREPLRIPISILHCTQLRVVWFSRTTVRFASVPIQRFLGNIQNSLRPIEIVNVYEGDTVHNQTVERCIITSIENVTSTLTEDEKTTFNIMQVRRDPILSYNAKNFISTWIEQFVIPHSLFHVTYAELFTAVWNRIIKHENANELKKVLNEEILNSANSCVTGKYSRLVASLAGFYPDVVVGISEADQIGNVIWSVRHRLGDKYTINEHKRLARIELKSLGINCNKIEEWIRNITNEI